METGVVRINEEAKQRLRLLAEETGESMSSVLEKAIETYRRKRFLESVNEAYRSLRKDKKGWASLQEERARWDRASMDGLDPDEDWKEKK